MTKAVRVIINIFLLFLFSACLTAVYAHDDTSLHNFSFNSYKKPEIEIDFTPSETYPTPRQPSNQVIEQSSKQTIKQSGNGTLKQWSNLSAEEAGKQSNHQGQPVSFGDLLNTPTPTINNSPNNKSVLIAEILAQLEESYQEKGLLSPTPFIPLPTFIAGVKEIVESNIKPHYTIALLGDSMTDTLGPNLPHLSQLLKQNYPEITFTLLNYGFGSTDLESGLFRLTNATKYLGTDFLPLLSQKPDILVVESFAYNHWSGQMHDLDRQWLTIAKIIETVKTLSPDTKIILAATIAPNADTFGDGALNWPKELKWDSAIITKAYLQNLINFATSQNYPLADAYHPSFDAEGNGNELYINQGDHLHPSDEGKLLFSRKIVEAIKENNLLN